MDSQSCALSSVQATQFTQKERRPEGRLSVHQSFVELDGGPSGHEAPHDGYDREHEEEVNQATADVEYHEAEQPQNEKNYRDRPQHCPGSAKKD
jgi:hypothetical protein